MSEKRDTLVLVEQQVIYHAVCRQESLIIIMGYLLEVRTFNTYTYTSNYILVINFMYNGTTRSNDSGRKSRHMFISCAGTPK